jgi:membrane protein
MGSMIGVIILLVGSTAVFVELQKSLKFNVEVLPQKIFIILKATFFIWINISYRFLLLVSLIISTGLSSIAN